MNKTKKETDKRTHSKVHRHGKILTLSSHNVGSSWNRQDHIPHPRQQQHHTIPDANIFKVVLDVPVEQIYFELFIHTSPGTCSQNDQPVDDYRHSIKHDHFEIL